MLVIPLLTTDFRSEKVGLSGSQAVSQLTWLEIKTPEALILETQIVSYILLSVKNIGARVTLL
ncbi:MAG: hypothetical protein PUP93_06500 [Rhizonema sp. NSF051]|nr:hypothetical protein [Rhizonema sp. NSF051]